MRKAYVASSEGTGAVAAEVRHTTRSKMNCVSGRSGLRTSILGMRDAHAGLARAHVRTFYP